MKLGRLVRRFGRLDLTAVVAVAIGLSACSGQGDSLVDAPTIPGDTPVNPTFRAAAFIVDVDARNKKVKITAPPKGVELAPSFSGSTGPSASLVGGDVVELTASGFDAPLPGAPCQGTTISQANKICVSFDISVRNVLNSVELIGPTVFPGAPAGTTGPLLFPFEQVVTTTSGGTSTGGQGNDIIVELPNRGLVEANNVWDGAPHNFFNDALCAAADNDCFRWEEYPSPIGGGFTVGPRRVGFFIDPTVGNFRSRMLVAADLRNAGGGGPTTGTVTGTLTTTVPGVVLSGTVTIQTGGFTGTITAGSFSVGSVTSGSKTISFSGLPAGCVAAPVTATLNPGATLTIGPVVVTGCTPPAGGSVQGLVNSSLGGALAGVSVTLSSGGSNTTGAPGTFSITSAVGTSGTASITAVPAGCTAPAGSIGAYSITTSGQVVTLPTVTVTCVAPAANSIVGTWSQTASTATLTLRVNITSGNVGTAEGQFVWGASRLTWNNATAASGTNLSNVFGAPVGTLSPVSFGAFTTTAGGLTGNVGWIVLNFNIAAGASQSIAACNPGAACPLLAALTLLDAGFGDIAPTFNQGGFPSITIPALTIP